VAKNSYEEPPIYNFTISDDNPITIQQYMDYGFKHGEKIPASQALWYYTFTLTPSPLWYKFLIFWYHIVPAFFMDAVLAVIGKKRMMLRMYDKIHKFQDAVYLFNVAHYTFRGLRLRGLLAKLSSVDRQMFDFDMATLDWDDYTRIGLAGMRQYLLKDDPKTIPAALKKTKR
jgi:fatty acyl-CoA reductase